MYLKKVFSFNEHPSRFIPIVTSNAKDLAFCYALIRQSDDNIQEISEQCQSKISIVFLSILIIYKEFLHGFPFLYITSIEGREKFRDIFVRGIRIVIYSPTPKQNTNNYINS